MAKVRGASHKGELPIRITTAQTSRNEDIAARQKRYILSMSIRSVCFIGAVFAGLAHITWLWPILIAAAIVLPYVAVVMANAANTKGDGFNLLDSPYGRPELRGGREWREEHHKS
ncbi:DUF3099 domain-containing protein [Nocardioides sp. DS6]|uniref:DUF3099 domain-containing protein n=1 Tax=Nocardioides eburneus TaxID=3231482 RepID=A0ABV3SW50_9ACTN